jgi:Uri superfamily endonuclease
MPKKIERMEYIYIYIGSCLDSFVCTLLRKHMRHFQVYEFKRQHGML